MARKRSTNPTEGELAILRVLWERGPSTVRQVHDTLAAVRDVAYTTTLKLLQLMLEKGVAIRAEVGRTHLYRATVPQHETQRRLVRDLLDRAFNGSAAQLVVHALAAKPATPDELRELRRLLGAYEAESRPRAAVRRGDGKEKDRG